MIVGYARVSSVQQNLDLQLDALAAAGCEKVFQEKRSGGVLEGRDELVKCIEFVREGDTLIVWKLDRLGRNMRDLIDMMAKLEEKGVIFKSLKEGVLDTSTAIGKMMFHFLGTIAEMELDILKERQKAGLEKYAEKRKRAGAAQKSETHRVREMELRRIYNEEGITKPKEIAKKMNVSLRMVYVYGKGLFTGDTGSLKRVIEDKRARAQMRKLDKGLAQLGR